MLKNTAGQNISAQLVAVADGEDVTSGTTTVYVTGDGGTQSTGSGTVTHEGNGEWSYAPTQGETNYSHVKYTFVNTTAITVGINVYPRTFADYMADVSGLATAVNLATVDTVVDAIKVSTDNLPSDPADQSLVIAATDAITAAIAALNDLSVSDVLTTQMTEAYAADGTAPTLAQALFLIQQALTEFAYSGTTNTVKKLDGSTTAATFTLDDASDPTSQTRAT